MWQQVVDGWSSVCYRRGWNPSRLFRNRLNHFLKLGSNISFMFQENDLRRCPAPPAVNQTVTVNVLGRFHINNQWHADYIALKLFLFFYIIWFQIFVFERSGMKVNLEKIVGCMKCIKCIFCLLYWYFTLGKMKEELFPPRIDKKNL